MIIVRTLFDVEDNESRIYDRAELSFQERTILDIVNSPNVRLERNTNDDHTVLTYSIL